MGRLLRSARSMRCTSAADALSLQDSCTQGLQSIEVSIAKDALSDGICAFPFQCWPFQWLLQNNRNAHVLILQWSMHYIFVCEMALFSSSDANFEDELKSDD